MKLIVVKNYEEMSEVAAKIFKDTIIEKTNTVLGGK
jgi:glucosamine-6-phosphate deaminase